MKKNLLFSLLLIVFFSVGTTIAQSSSAHQNIFDELAAPDSVNHARVIVNQDRRIALLMNGKTNNGFHDVTSNGYRVQVFSSNVPRTAKNEAFNIEREIQDRFPNLAIYVNYISPFWKVRVGDFKTMQEAQSLREQLISAFPNLRSETYIVKEQINVSSDN